MDSALSRKTAFVSGYEWDVFVSYAHADNFQGWVSGLVENLVGLLPGQLRGANLGRVWLDRRLDPGLPFPKEIAQAVERAATLLVILSPSYLESEWCRRERELFVDAAKRAGADPKQRIFIVDMKCPDRAAWPEVFADKTTFQFWYAASSQEPPHTLAWPRPDTSAVRDRPYFERLDDLSRSIATRLVAMREAIDKGPHASMFRANGQQIGVLLAEVTPDLQYRREQLARSLRQAGFLVLPESYYPRDPAAFEAKIREDLPSCALMVQLLGRYVTARTENLPGGYELLQRKVAMEAGVPVFNWRDPAIDPEAEDVHDRALLGAADVIALPFADLLAAVSRQARLAARKQERDELSGPWLVLIQAENRELGPHASEIYEVLDRLAINYLPVLPGDSLVELACDADIAAHGVLVIAETNENGWTEMQLRELRKLMLRERKDEVVHIRFGPHASGVRVDKGRLRARLTGPIYFEGTDDPNFEQFLQALKQCGPREGNNAKPAVGAL